ncbi:MAG: GspH/FimT family pseudopilin [Hyphomicrobiaceae bacterium]
MRASLQRPSPTESGFTLLELAVVLGILALAASLAFPRVQGANTGTTLETTARRLTSALQLAHAESRRTNTGQALILDLDHGTYWSTVATSRVPIPRPITLTIQDDGFEWSGTNRLIRFTPSGSATGGTIALTSGNATARITVDWLTGSTTLATSR